MPTYREEKRLPPCFLDLVTGMAHSMGPVFQTGIPYALTSTIQLYYHDDIAT